MPHAPKTELLEPVAISVHRVAFLLGVSTRKAWTLVGTGELPSFRVGRRRLVRFADVQRFAAERVGEKAEEAAR
jgi:excisionase family DNA binding protein